MCVCLSHCTEGSLKAFNRYSSPLQGSFSYVLGRFETILGEGTPPPEKYPLRKISSTPSAQKYSYTRTDGPYLEKLADKG